MSNEALDRLAAALHAPPPATLGEHLDPAQLDTLTDALTREHARRATGLNEAAEEALALVPALARGPVRRILFKQ
ncbi:hypothetical protein GCM10010329_11830 [Streptomyces spiroverticillatus]|uniref:Uncharacterized protein n=1 Tax=Streptomyces finlayi TaxID=67296 RepID=A0A918WXW5_9ACTN|nr:hypothetical protein [Streptomyces finlayi]GGZ92693.1 hypothetical protein GCM10010329_11830 [Streptomyces spiroverticillatus]GHC92855.1 hypothetical protein GCM10010334_29270 [Streptomyces finlayi]